MASLLSFFRRFVAYAPGHVALDFGLMLLLGVLQGVGILLLIPLLSYVGLTDGAGGGAVASIAAFFFEQIGLPRSLPVILVLYVGLVSLVAVLTRRQSVLNQVLQLGFVRGLRREVFAALLYADWRFLTASRQAAFTQTLTHDVQRTGQAAFFLLRGLVMVIMLAVYFVIALRLSVPMTLVTVVAAVVMAWLLRGKLRAARTTGAAQTRTANDLFGEVTEHLAGIKEIRSYGAEGRTLDRFDAASLAADDVRLQFMRHHTASSMWMGIGSVGMLSVLLLVAVEVLHLPLASLLLLIYLFSRMLPQGTQLQQTVLQLLNVMPAFEAVERLLAQTRDAAEPSTHAPTPPLHQAVRFEAVSFAYTAGRPTVADVTFAIPARQTTALVGPSGAGKSTVAHLLLGLLTPQTGRLLLDGAPLTPAQLRGWRDRIGYVPQETFLLHDTVRANLLWAVPEADEAALREALDQAAALPFVDALPDGLDTVVGDRGVRLSGGERQRIALARALLRRPSLLVLDEATSALDLESERRIFEALDRLHGHLTILVITHRLTSVRDADQLVVMEAGRVVETGTWEALMTREAGCLRRLAQEVPGETLA